ncbi:YicC/YloC family endoribonuclease [Sessilibacter corallicola]|uniref:YicC/YloC family endoribonuclease n=1 Tax=Sessilibacter corallicola TaxID=2904075 RepID=UPI001E386F4B|nr:YicC/YloC family endoribonuclease [Sessilibacter corallicola]MCE2027888.1 YicC family protein [Sessilibacter corallicola]
MTHSMTGFARNQETFTWAQLTWEIRSINHRYLEPHFRLPETLRLLEPNLREILRNKIARGKVEVSLQVQKTTTQQTINIDENLAKEVIQAAETINHQLSKPATINPMQILQWPGVIQESEIDPEQAKANALSSFSTAVDDLIQQRAREGKELKNHITNRLDQVNALVEKTRLVLPELKQNQRNKLLEKLSVLEVEVDQDRLEQELVYLAQKSDVDEELDRLETHANEVKNCLNQKKPVGRRLDFLMQELNREANTLSSKATVSDTTQTAVELKVLIEQMREQVQNIE